MRKIVLPAREVTVIPLKSDMQMTFANRVMKGEAGDVLVIQDGRFDILSVAELEARAEPRAKD